MKKLLTTATIFLLLALTASQCLIPTKSTGNNLYGQLIQGKLGFPETPTLFHPEIFKDVKSVDTNRHTLIMLNNGSVYGFGVNNYRQTGINVAADITTPTLISILNATMISAGGYFSLFLTSDGIYGVGDNTQGQLGDGTTTSRQTLTKSSSNDKDITAFATGNVHSLYLRSDGKVYSFGYNFYGQLGLGNKVSVKVPTLVSSQNSDIVAIAAGEFHSLMLKSDGRLFAFGNNEYGQLGDGTLVDKLSPTQIDSSTKAIASSIRFNIILKNDDKVYGFGTNNKGQLGDGTLENRNISTPMNNENSNVASIYTGHSMSYFVKNDGTFYATGDNGFGQLGDETDISKTSPTLSKISNVQNMKCGDRYCFIIKNDGMIYSLGFTSQTKLLPDTVVSPTNTLEGVCKVNSISSGYDFSMALLNDGSVQAFGKNDVGQLGDGTKSKKIQVGKAVAVGVKSMAVCYYHSLILFNDGTVKAFGGNFVGQLGDGTKISRDVPTPIQSENFDIVGVTCGNDHSMILNKDGRVFGFGWSEFGQLGDQNYTTMRLNSTPLGSENYGIDKVTAGGLFTFILRNGTAYGFGYNFNGQLGDGTTKNKWQPTFMSNNVVDLSAGREFTLVLKTDGKLYSCGRGTYGELGDGTTTSRTTLGLVSITITASSGIHAFSAGAYHGMIVKTDGSIYTFGRNVEGQLGDNTTVNRNKPTFIFNGTGINAVSGGRAESFFYLSYPLSSTTPSTSPNSGFTILPSSILILAIMLAFLWE